MSYDYKPLQEGQIRLLKIRRNYDNKIVGKLHTRSLSSCMGKYVAISYAWSSEEMINFHEGGFLTISQTLSDLFTDGLPQHAKTYLWIDAVCINQADMSERQSQVAMMNSIYRMASHVLVWLGTTTAVSQAAFKTMNSRKWHVWPEDWDSEDSKILSEDLKNVFLLLEAKWFRRTWVIQEYALNKTVVIVCGKDIIDSVTFHNCICAVWKYFQLLGDYDRDHLAFRGLWNATRLLFIRRAFQRDGRVSFERLVEAAHHSDASKECDKIYGLLGLGDLPLPIRYDIPAEEVYRLAAESCLCSGASLDLLALGGSARRCKPSTLPTWVPDPRNFCYDEPITAAMRGRYNAGQAHAHLSIRAKKVGERYLLLRVQRFDTIAETFTTFNSRSVETQQRVMREIASQRKMLAVSMSDGKWYAYLTETMTMGLDIDDEDIGPEYVEYFIEWNQWLESRTTSTDEDLSKIKHNRFYRTLGPTMDGWKFCLTRMGHLCIGPSSVQPGDAVYCVPGCHLPLILRSTNCIISLKGILRRRKLPMYTIVNWCYFQGLMGHQGLVPSGSPTEIVLH